MKKILNIFEILILAYTILLYYFFAFPLPSMSRILRLEYANDTVRLIIDILLIVIFIVRIVFIIRSFSKPWTKMKRLHLFERILFLTGIFFLTFEIIFFLNIYIVGGLMMPMYAFYAIILLLSIILWSIELKKRNFKIDFIKIKR